jgi:CheY-like chemotaxis protein
MARILVIEDDAAIRAVVKCILERKGNVVVLAEGGHHGAEAIEAYAFDIAIVDLFLPTVNSLAVIETFLQSAPSLPIIVMSSDALRTAAGEPAPDCFRMALELGAAAWLCKPFTPMQLLHAVEACQASAAVASRAVGRLSHAAPSPYSNDRRGSPAVRSSSGTG